MRMTDSLRVGQNVASSRPHIPFNRQSLDAINNNAKKRLACHQTDAEGRLRRRRQRQGAKVGPSLKATITVWGGNLRETLESDTGPLSVSARNQ